MLSAQQRRMILCIVYVSEGARPDVLRRIAATTKVVHSFADTVYGRTSFFMTGTGDTVADRALLLCNEAFQAVDYRGTSGTHPALGAVDHVTFQPLGPATTMAETVAAAHDFSQKLYQRQRVPVFNYGAASPRKEALKDLRKRLGYFEKSSISAALTPDARIALFLDRIRAGAAVEAPTFGDVADDLVATKGVTLVGAVPFVLNFNMRFRAHDPREAVAKVTAAVRDAQVEALTLTHLGGACEVACNLKAPAVVTPNDVLARARAAIDAQRLDIEIQQSYTTGPTEDELLEAA
jgi:hypothetical protein